MAKKNKKRRANSNIKISRRTDENRAAQRGESAAALDEPVEVDAWQGWGTGSKMKGEVEESIIQGINRVDDRWSSFSGAGKKKKGKSREQVGLKDAESPVQNPDEEGHWGFFFSKKSNKGKKKVTFEGTTITAAPNDTKLRNTWGTTTPDPDFDAPHALFALQPKDQERAVPSVSASRKGKQATVEDVDDTDDEDRIAATDPGDDTQRSLRPRSSLDPTIDVINTIDDPRRTQDPSSASEHPDPPKLGMNEGKDNTSPTPSEHASTAPSEHSIVPKHSIGIFSDKERLPRSVEASLASNFHEESSEESDEGWDYIDEIEPSDSASRLRPQSERIRHRSVSGRRQRSCGLDSYDDYPSQPYGGWRRTPSIGSFDDCHRYPRPNRHPRPPYAAPSGYEHGPNLFSPFPTPYGYLMPGYPSGPYASQIPYGYVPPLAPSAPPYGAIPPGYPKVTLNSAPMLPTLPRYRTPSPPTPPALPPPPPPLSPYPSDTAQASPDLANKLSDSEEAGPSQGRYRKQKKKVWELKGRRYPRRPHYHYHHHLRAGSQRDPKNPRCHAYNVPIDDNGEPLSIDIKIRGFGREQPLKGDLVGWGFWSQADMGQNYPNREQTNILNILGAKRLFDSESHYKLDLTCSSQPSGDDGSTDRIRWLHVERQRLEFDEFTIIVLEAPHLSQDWKILLLSLLKRIRKLHYDHSTNHLSPWTLRADSADLGLTGVRNTTLSATAVSFPYFALGSFLGHGPMNTDCQYPIMSLFEWDDRFESAKEWKTERLFRLMNEAKDSNDSIIYVPHIWAITFSDSESSLGEAVRRKLIFLAIVTYGQLAFSDLISDDSIRIIEQDLKAPGRNHRSSGE